MNYIHLRRHESSAIGNERTLSVDSRRGTCWSSRLITQIIYEQARPKDLWHKNDRHCRIEILGIYIKVKKRLLYDLRCPACRGEKFLRSRLGTNYSTNFFTKRKQGIFYVYWLSIMTPMIMILINGSKRTHAAETHNDTERDRHNEILGFGSS